jgi:hypothetical protein
MLTTEGEAFSETELTSCLEALVGAGRAKEIAAAGKDGGEFFTAGHFADEILGFEDFAGDNANQGGDDFADDGQAQ